MVWNGMECSMTQRMSFVTRISPADLSLQMSLRPTFNIHAVPLTASALMLVILDILLIYLHVSSRLDTKLCQTEAADAATTINNHYYQYSYMYHK